MMRSTPGVESSPNVTPDVDHDPAPVLRRAVGVGVEVHPDFATTAKGSEDEFRALHFSSLAGLAMLRSYRMQQALDGDVAVEDGRCVAAAPSNSEATPPVAMTVIGLAVLCLDAFDQPVDQVDIAPEHAGLHGGDRVLADYLVRLLDGAHAAVWRRPHAAPSWTG